MDKNIQDYCWTLKLSDGFKEKLSPFVMPRIKQAISFIGLTFRYLSYHKECTKQKIAPHMDFFNPVTCRQVR